MPIGMPIEVMTNFNGSWAGGFEIAEPDPEGYRVRRVSDGVVLPMVFTEDRLRIR